MIYCHFLTTVADVLCSFQQNPSQNVLLFIRVSLEENKNLPLLIGVAGDFCFWAEELSGQFEFLWRVVAVVDGSAPQKEVPLHGLRVRGLILLRFAKR